MLRANELLSTQIPRIAQRAERMVLRVLVAAGRADEDGSDDDEIRLAASGIRLAPDDPQLTRTAVRESRQFHEGARIALRRGDFAEAVGQQTRAFGANPVDAEIVGSLAYLRLRQSPGQAEAARRLALHALTLHDWKYPSGRIEDWNTFAIASALTGRERDARNAWLVALALAGGSERQCRAALDAYALYGEALRSPVEAMLYRANAATALAALAAVRMAAALVGEHALTAADRRAFPAFPPKADDRMIRGRASLPAPRTHRMKPTEARTLPKTLGTFPLWGIAVGLVISGEYFGWSYGWDKAGTLGFLVTAAFVALMYTTFIFSFTELTTAIPNAGGPFEYSRRAFGPTGGYIAGFATLVEFVFAPPAIALAIGAYVNVQFPALEPKWVALGAYLVFMALNIAGMTIAASFELAVTLIAIFELLRLHGRGGAGLLGRQFRSRAAGPAPTRFSIAAVAGHLRRDSVRDLVLPGDRGRGHGRRGSEGPEPLDTDRLHRRHPDAGGAGARRDGVRRRRRRLDQARQHQRAPARRR